MVVFYSWGGFSKERSIHMGRQKSELFSLLSVSSHNYLYGFDDETIGLIRNADPQTGGNPSLPSCLYLNDNNVTEINPNTSEKYYTCGTYDYLAFN